MRYLYQEKSGSEIFLLEEGDAEILFPCYAKEPLIFSSDQAVAKEAILAQMELNEIAKNAYVQHLWENGKDAHSEDAKGKLCRIDDSMRKLFFYLSGRPDDIMNYRWILEDESSFIAGVVTQKSTVGFLGTE